MKFGKRAASPTGDQGAGGHVPAAVIPPTAKPRQTDIKEFAPVQQPNALQVDGPLPPSIGRCADLYSDVRALRLAMEKEVDAVKAREYQIREHIINNLSKSAKDGDSGASGLRYRAQIVTKEVPRAVDWPKIHAYVAEHNRFDLLQKRLGERALADMHEAKEAVPGVEWVIVPEVSITKVGR